MTLFVTLSADCEAYGHPSACQEPAPGVVQEESAHGVSVTNASGESKQLATVASADMHFPKHGHSTSTDDDGNTTCTNKKSHTLDPTSRGLSSSVTINGSPIYLKKSAVQSDPLTGDDIDIINAGVNNSITESP